MSTIFHPVSGEKVLLVDLDSQSAFIEDRLYTPASWNKFYFDEEDHGSKTYGIEIELNVSGKDVLNRVEICKSLLKVLNRDGRHFHIMRDNSVRNGIELVSAPMSYKYFMNTFDAEEINDLFQSLKLTATIDTGLHIHVGERHTQRIRELYIQLISISYPMWVYLSDRRIKRLQERYVSTKYFAEKKELKNRFDATIKSLLYTGKSNIDYKGIEYYDYHYEDRYSGLNFTNQSTIEFRLFSGTNNVYDIQKYLTLVNATACLVDEISEKRVNDVYTLNKFVERTSSEELLQETIKYIKFINDTKNRDRIYYNEFMLVDSHWYRIPRAHAKRRDFAIEKNVYDEYIAIKKELHENHKYPNSMNLKYDINNVLSTNMYEVVREDDGIYLIKTKGETNMLRLDEEAKNEKYIFLRGVNSQLLINK